MAWLHIHYNSEILRMPVSMEAFIPELELTKDKAASLNALYLLHDMGDDHTFWMRRSSIESFVKDKNTALIMPAGHLGYYTNMKYGRDYFKFITEELPAVCERFFPLSSNRENRAICGYGIGGYGAVKAGLLSGDKYKYACSINGCLDILKVYDKMPPKLAEEVFGSKNTLESGNDNLNVAANSQMQKSEIIILNENGNDSYADSFMLNNILNKLSIENKYCEYSSESKCLSLNTAIENMLRLINIT